jgi:hypothetical protein
MGDACNVLLHGWASCGNVLCLQGVHPLQQQRYFCSTHRRLFTVTDDLMCSVLYKHHTWDEVQPEPLIVKHGQTYMTTEFLADIIAMFEKNVTINQIVDIVQHRWRAVFALNAAEFARHTRQPVVTVPWWETQCGHAVFSDRRKVFAIISAYFQHFLRDNWQAGLLTARRQLCYGVSMDETFKVALKCSVKTVDADGRVKYKSAPYAVHTVFSLQTRMCVGFRFMPNKSNEQKQVLVEEVFKAQATNMNEDVVVTRFVSTDSPTADHNMLVTLHAEVFRGHPLAGELDVGDDLYHVLLRIGRTIPACTKWMKSSLLAVLKRGTSCGSKPAGLPMDQWQIVCASKLSHDLDVWVAQHEPDAQVQEQISIAQRKLHHLFAFLPHAQHLLDAGTTSNEHGNWCLNRRTKFVAHMRPDHTALVLEYTLYLRNRAAATSCMQRDDVPAAVKALAGQLFPNPTGIAFAEVASKGEVPFVFPFSSPQRQYTLADYTAEFGASRRDRQQHADDSSDSGSHLSTETCSGDEDPNDDGDLFVADDDDGGVAVAADATTGAANAATGDADAAVDDAIVGAANATVAMVTE